ncbi:MAG: DUF5372 family protein [Pirellulaceae bacterium]
MRVYYPFHPLCGQDLKVLRTYCRSPDTVVVVDLSGRRLAVLRWMISPKTASCPLSTTATLSARPLLVLADLLELQAVHNAPQ